MNTYIYIDYGGHQLRLKCAQVHHRSPAGTFTRVPGRCLHWSPTPPGPRWPPAYIYNINNRSFTSMQMCHTHTPCLWQGGATENEVKMRMKGKWRWDGHEDEMKRYLTRTRRGERKRRRREHQHNTPGPERANPERAREKKSGGSTDTEQDQRRGGKDESAWTNLTRREPTHTSARDGTDLPGQGRTHEVGDQWGQVGETTKRKTRLSS